MAETTAESEVQSTEITFKTITQDVFKMSFPTSTTIGEVKNKIFSDKGDDFEVERQKLIYNGKVLNDTQTLGEVNVDDKKYIVVMVSKKKVEQPVVAQSSSTAAAEPAKVETPAPESAPSASVPATVAPSNTAVTPEQEETVSVVTSMGYPRDEVIRALRAAFWNADRAVEYLCSGVPENTADAEENPAEGLLEDQALGEGEDPLDFLRQSPQFAQLCQLVRAQPDMLPQVLSQIDNTNPELMQIIRGNQEAFLQMLNESVEGIGGEQIAEGGGVAEEGGEPAHDTGHLTIAVTEADRNALQRLQAMGFPEQLVIEAYFSCEKNEELAVNYILSRMDEMANDE